MFLAVDRDDDFIEMPLVAHASSAAADFVGAVLTEFLGPASISFMDHVVIPQNSPKNL
jgi:hypothetical protein